MTQDDIAADCVADMQGDVETPTPQRPPGMPPLRPYRTLSRRERAQLARGIKPILAAADAFEDVTDEDMSSEDSGELLAVAAETVADMQDALVIVAVDPPAWLEWAEDVTDGEVRAAFAWYMARFEVAKALASSLS